MPTETLRSLALKSTAGGLSCAIISTCLNPMDNTKVRLQVQSQLGATTGKHYSGFINALTKTIRNEGITTLFTRGLTASMIREMTYSSMRMGLYDFFKQIFIGDTPIKDASLISKIFAGASSGAVGSFLVNPCDLVKIRIQGQLYGSPRRYASTFQAFGDVYRREGLRGLYKGVGPTTMRAAVLTGSQMASYDHSKVMLLKTPYFQDNFYLHLVSSIIAGFVTSVTTNPFDTVKTRYMNDKARGVNRLYKGGVDCFIKTVKMDGVFGLFRGFIPNYLRLGPHFIVSLPLYEQYRRIFGVGYV